MDFNIRKPAVLAAGCIALFSPLMIKPQAAQADAISIQASQSTPQAPAADKGDTTIIIKDPIITKDGHK